MIYDKREPRPQPVRHTWKFTPEEVAEALSDYAKAKGSVVPDGKRSVWGIEDRRKGDAALTLAVEE